MKQTAVEWLESQILEGSINIENGEMYIKLPKDALKKAKEMEKEQIGKAFLNGRLKEIGSGVLFDLQPLTETFHNYYNETFNKQ